MKYVFQFEFDSTSGEFNVINVSTGEIKSANCKKKTTKVESDTCTVMLESNKLIFTNKACELLNITTDDRVVVNYDGNTGKPVIGKAEAFEFEGGNKLTKSNTIRFSGKANEQLAQFGDTFTLEPHPINKGLFFLKGNKELPKQDDRFNVEDLDISLDELISDTETNTTVTAWDFSL